MAACSNPNCNKQVGCGCNLKEGLCATCYIAKKNQEALEAQNKLKVNPFNINGPK